MLHNMVVDMCNHHLVHWMSIFLFIEWLLLGLEELQALIMAHSSGSKNSRYSLNGTIFFPARISINMFASICLQPDIRIHILYFNYNFLLQF